MYNRLQFMSLRFFTHTRIGELMSRLNTDVVGAHNAISNTIVTIATNLIQTLAILIVMLALEWRLTLLSMAILPIFLFVVRPMGNILRSVSRRQMDANAHMNAMLNETLSVGGVLLGRLFDRRQAQVGRFKQFAAKVRDLGVRRAFVGSATFMLIGLVGAVGTAMVYGIGGYLAIRGSLTLGTIVAFGAYIGNLYGALRSLANAPVEFAASMVSFERVFEVIDLPQEIADRAGARPLSRVTGKLVFENVTFKYEQAQDLQLKEVRRYGGYGMMMGAPAGISVDSPRPTMNRNRLPAENSRRGDMTEIMSDRGPEAPCRHQARPFALYKVSFEVKPGQLVALVGPSGAGKTTLAYLIPRLYDVTGGRILIDGHDLRDVTLHSLIANVGMVTQEPYLLHDTIRANLLYAKADAGQAELDAATRGANIYDFIMGLPEGYETIAGERGYRLSGGEKQRIALARVILKDPKIIVLDEATSHLDSESETLIQETLQRLMAGRTSIVIAHRLSTILAADQILVLDRGRIVERGSHRELLARNGQYAALFRSQFAQGRDPDGLI